MDQITFIRGSLGIPFLLATGIYVHATNPVPGEPTLTVTGSKPYSAEQAKEDKRTPGPLLTLETKGAWVQAGVLQADLGDDSKEPQNVRVLSPVGDRADLTCYEASLVLAAASVPSNMAPKPYDAMNDAWRAALRDKLSAGIKAYCAEDQDTDPADDVVHQVLAPLVSR